MQLRIGEREFAGNNQGTVLDQANKQGVELPWSCRAGICGSCKQTLVSGGWITPMPRHQRRRAGRGQDPRLLRRAPDGSGDQIG